MEQKSNMKHTCQSRLVGNIPVCPSWLGKSFHLFGKINVPSRDRGAEHERSMKITHPTAEAVSPLIRGESNKSSLVERSEIPIFLWERGGSPILFIGKTGCVICGIFSNEKHN